MLESLLSVDFGFHGYNLGVNYKYAIMKITPLDRYSLAVFMLALGLTCKADVARERVSNL